LSDSVRLFIVDQQFLYLIGVRHLCTVYVSKCFSKAPRSQVTERRVHTSRKGVPSAVVWTVWIAQMDRKGVPTSEVQRQQKFCCRNCWVSECTESPVECILQFK